MWKLMVRSALFENLAYGGVEQLLNQILDHLAPGTPEL